MDHSDERRGRPTVHTRWSEDVAILAGDYLMALSYRLLSESPALLLPEMLSVYHEMVAELCEGQTLDKAFEGRDDVTVEEYFAMIDAKTGALLRTCLELGAILGGATDAERSAVRDAGTFVGRAFQIQDDLLDVVAQDARWGKPLGGDLIEGKRTYVLLRSLAVLEGEPFEWFKRILDRKGLEPERVEEARSRMQDAGVLDEARSQVQRLTDLAQDRLLSLPGRSLERVAALFDSMVSREH
jgi:geranylgeranyl diphosphate synthase type II